MSSSNFYQTEIINQFETIISDEPEIAVTDERDWREYIDNYDPKLVKLFEVEGNYTNSGNRELLVFYQKKNTMMIEGEKRDFIDLIYCFILDSINEKVLLIHKIPEYQTTPPFLGEINIDKDPMEELGRDVTWLGHRIGCIGDFNQNGKEELYLFSAYAIGIDPYFYEFNDTEFVRITDNHYGFARIIGIDKDNKILHFGRTSKARSLGNFSLIWNVENQRYELLTEEP